MNERTYAEPRAVRPPITPPVALSLQRSAGNAAVARMLAREPAPAANVDRDRLNGIEHKLALVARNAQGRSDRINKASDGCIGSLKTASDHLKAQGANYKVAHGRFQRVLALADVKHESDKDLEETVQGLLVAAAVAAIGVEVVAVKGAQWAARKMAASSYAAVQRVGVRAQDLAAAASERVADAAKAPVGEYAEQKAGKAVDAGKEAAQAGGVGAKPSETAGGVASSGDQFERAFAALDEMIGALPELGEAARSQVALAMAAQELGKEALRLAGAGDARFTLDEIVDKSVVLVADDMLARADEQAAAAEQAVQRLLAAILRKPIKDPDTIEVQLWQTWMAGLQDPRVLDNDEIEKHLGPKGLKLIDFGDFTFPWETRDAVTRAQQDVARGSTGANPAAPVPGTAVPAPPAP